MPVFQVDAPVFHPHHRAGITGLDVLDHHARLGGLLGRAGLAPARGQNVGSVAIEHPAILGSPAADSCYGTPFFSRVIQK